MTYFIFLFLVGLVLGLVAVASNPAPYFAALGLVVAAAAGCGVLASHGGSFFIFNFISYLFGGMLVVFAYSAALAAEPYPEAWGSWSVLGYVVFYISVVVLGAFALSGGWYDFSWVVADEYEHFSVVRGDCSGVAYIYSSGGWMLLICGWALFLTLFVVLELTRGLSRGTLRAV